MKRGRGESRKSNEINQTTGGAPREIVKLNFEYIKKLIETGESPSRNESKLWAFEDLAHGHYATVTAKTITPNLLLTPDQTRAGASFLQRLQTLAQGTGLSVELADHGRVSVSAAPTRMEALIVREREHVRREK